MQKYRCFSLVASAGAPIGGGVGALLDERIHQGISTWLGLCRGAAIGYGTALKLALVLMPLALCAMLLLSLAGTLAATSAWRARPAAPLAREMLGAQAGCLLAALCMPLACPALLTRAATAGYAIAAMVTLDWALAALFAMTVLRLAAARADPLRIAPAR